MSGPTGQWHFGKLPSNEFGDAYRAMKLPSSGIQWKEGYPVVHFSRGASGELLALVGAIVIARIVKVRGSFPWEWASEDSIKPVRASGEAITLAVAKHQIEGVVREICGTPRP